MKLTLSFLCLWSLGLAVLPPATDLASSFAQQESSAATNAAPRIESWARTARFGTPTFRHPYDIFATEFSADGKTLMTAGGRSVILWDIASARRMKTCEPV